MQRSSEKKTEIRERLLDLAEPEYQKFSSSLLPGVENVLGVRLPKLRKLAEQLAAKDWKGYADSIALDGGDGKEVFFEEIMLKGFLIGYARRRAKAPLSEILAEAKDFLPLIDNWSVCDSFCSTLKIAGRHRAQLWPFVLGCLRSGEEYTVRFGAVLLLDYYVDRAYLGEALAELERVDHDSYYVKMAVAWALSMFYLEFPKETGAFLADCRLDDFTYHKALQKICESRRADREMKERVRTMRRKSGEGQEGKS